MPDGNKYGIWVGDNATVAVTEKLMIAFLRLRKDNIVSILRHKDEGVVAGVNGMAFGMAGEESATLPSRTQKPGAD